MLGRVLGGLAAFGVVLLLGASSSRAQDVAPGGEAPRKAPRLVYKRGPAECLPELEFRREVAIAGDGVDRFDATGTDVMLVRFERTARGYRGTIEFTEADGTKRKPKIEEHANCEVLGRWVGVSAYYYFPPRPEPAGVPAAKPDPVPSKEPAWAPPPLPPQQFESFSPPPPTSSLWDAIRKMDLTIGLYAYGLMTVGLTANVGPGFGIGADIRGEVISVGVELRGVPPGYAYASNPIVPADTHHPGHFDLSQWTGLLVPCARYKYFVGCGVAQGGVFVVSDLLGQRTLAALSFGPRVGFEVPFAERFAVFGFGEALFAATQAGWDDHTHNVEWTQSIVSGFFAAGLSVNFK